MDKLSEEDRWMRVGQAAREHRLREVVHELELKWPGRYDFRIVRTRARISAPMTGGTPMQAARNGRFALYLSHK